MYDIWSEQEPASAMGFDPTTADLGWVPEAGPPPTVSAGLDLLLAQRPVSFSQAESAVLVGWAELDDPFVLNVLPEHDLPDVDVVRDRDNPWLVPPPRVYDPNIGGGPPPGPPPPQDRSWDACEDRQADSLVASADAIVQSKTDANVNEYGVIVWKDASGNLNTTSLINGNNFRLSGLEGKSPTDFGFTSWSQVVALYQSHPTMRDTGTEVQPTGVYVPITPESKWHLPSGGDWQFLDFFVRNGASPSNLSIYISYAGTTREFDYADNLTQSRNDRDGQGGRGTESGDYQPGAQCP